MTRLCVCLQAVALSILLAAVGCATKSATNGKGGPGAAQAAYERGNSLFDAGRYAEARDAYEEALTLNPKHQSACSNYALCLKRLGRISDAVEAYQVALEMDPKDTRTRENLVYALEESGRLDRAALELRTLAAAAPEDAYTLKHLATVLIHLDQNREAAEYYEKSLKIRPGEADDYYNLGLCYFNMENWDSALTTWLTALAHDPKHAATNKGLAVAYWRRGDYDKAWEAVSQCGALGVVVNAEFIAALEKDSGKSGK